MQYPVVPTEPAAFNNLVPGFLDENEHAAATAEAAHGNRAAAGSPSFVSKGTQNSVVADAVNVPGQKHLPEVRASLARHRNQSSYTGSGRQSALISRKTVIAKDLAEQEKLRKKKSTPIALRVVNAIVENKVFTTLMTVLTIFALTGDDLRLICTDKPADEVFDTLTSVCLAIFIVEIVMSCLGKEDYFMGFFFILDCISTATLVLDLSSIDDAMQGSDYIDSGSSNGWEQLVAARSARVVRVIRLVRILKLYKAVLEAKRKKRRRFNGPGEDDDWWDDSDDTDVTMELRESRVGKKLSDLTTRRVIALVLVMMLALPLLQIDGARAFPTSAAFGAEVVFEAFNQATSNSSMSVSTSVATYERSLLQYIYYHNWYTARLDQCPQRKSACSRDWDAQLFWVGVVSSSQSLLSEKAQAAQISASAVDAFQQEAQAQRDMYVYGTMPSPVVDAISSTWTNNCPADEVPQRERLGISLLETTIDGFNSYSVRCPEDIRRKERKLFFARLLSRNEFEDWHLAFYFDIRQWVRQDSIYSLLVTAWVCISLFWASVLFTNDANVLVLAPIEAMISKVERIRSNPLVAIRLSDEDFKAEERQKAKVKQVEASREQNWLLKIRDKLMCSAAPRAAVDVAPMETAILEKTILKLGSLLALGFGEAGASIIEQNMSGTDSAWVDAMVEGTRVECVIGIARIREFNTMTEVLQAKVMTFVNQVSEIVHGCVDEFGGAANRNKGDTFLTIWRTSDLIEDKIGKQVDMAMVAFARILGAVHRSPVLGAYRGHPGLQQRLGCDFRVHLTSGLHFGWAIEGAVGSEFKIDASYLSPNLSIAEAIERATLVYGVSILLAESVIKMCTPRMLPKVRLIDRVIVPGSAAPMDVFCIDLDQSCLKVTRSRPNMPWNNRQRFKARQFLDLEKRAKWADDVEMVDVFDDIEEIFAMRRRYTVEFLHVFNMGYRNYKEGEWMVAQKFLTRARFMLGEDFEDGPSVALLRYMQETSFQAPDWWKGYHDLVEECEA